MEIPLRPPSTRRASLSAKRAWTQLRKSPSTTKSNKKFQPGKSDNEISLSSVNPTSDSKYGALSDLPIHSSTKQKKLSKNTFNKYNSNSRSKSNAQDIGLGESFVIIRSIDLGKREGLEEKRELPSTSSIQSNEVPSDCKENIDIMMDGDNSDSELASYMKIREQNLKANQEFLACIGMQKAKDEFETSIAKRKRFSTQRGLSKQRKDVKPLPRRHSLRIRRIDPTGIPLPEPEPVEEQFVEQRLPERVSMEERHYSKHQHVAEDLDLKPFFSTISSLKCEDNFPSVLVDTKANRKVISDIQNLKITEEQVAKVVPGRVYSVTWHPSKDSMIAVAGDAHGYVGCWNVLAKENDSNMVRAFQPHIRPVSHLSIPPSDGHKLYTCSYDATLRCGDFEKGVFDLVYSVPEENDDLFRNFDFIGNTSSMLVSHLSGLVSLVDCRTPSKSAEQVFNVSQSSLRKVSVHPLSTHYFITAGRDATIKLWDLRSMDSKRPKAVQIMRPHSKGIASAFFSPISGNQIVSSSTDDTIQIHTATEGMQYELTSRMRHNNHTGRWLTPFQPAWHPTAEGIFVSGSMARPRQIEVFNSNGGLIAALQGDYLGSVCSLNAFHPTRPTAIVGANSSGRLHVFM